MKEYVIRRGGTQVALVAAGTTTFNDTGLAAGTYAYAVAARDNANNTSAFTATVSATVTGSTVVGLDTRPSNTSCLAPDRPSSTTGVTLTRTFANLSFAEPVGLVQAPGDNTRWFVLERGGVIRVFSNSPTVTTSSVFLDLRSRINDAGEIEAGLLGLAFHPNFATNGKFYVFYSGPAVPNYRIGSRISEFTSADRQTASLSTERELIRAYKLEPNHNGGQLQFGPDGYLYAGLGDGGGANDPEGNGQNRTNLFGKIIRIDVNSGSPYAIPAGNPYAGQTSCTTTYSPANPSAPRAANCPEIYAYGLRNPGASRSTVRAARPSCGLPTWARAASRKSTRFPPRAAIMAGASAKAASASMAAPAPRPTMVIRFCLRCRTCHVPRSPPSSVVSSTVAAR